MKNLKFAFIFLSLVIGSSLQIAFAQEADAEPDLLAEFSKVDKKTSQKPIVWNGTWSYGSRYTPGTLKITNVSSTKFKFSIDALNGANMGEISGTAKIKGGKAYFDDKTDSKSDTQAYGCRMLFVNNGKSIEVAQSPECQSYGGLGVGFEGTYTKGKPVIKTNNFVQREVFPNSALDQKFKLLVGAKEYENFLNDFHLIYEDEDLDKLNAKVFSGCVRGICPFNAAIIMFDDKNNLWAAITNVNDESKTYIHYYTNNPDWSGRLPKTIDSWVEDKRSMNKDLTVIYKNRK